MTKQAKNYLDRFLNPTGLGMILALGLTLLNLYASTQLFPVIRNIDDLNHRVANLEQKVDGQNSIIIPKNELDQKFENIKLQIDDLKAVVLQIR